MLTAQQQEKQQKVATRVAELLGNASVTFAGIAYTTQVKTAAAHKARNVQKHTTANVQLFSTLQAATDVFANAVKRSAAKFDSNEAGNVAQFETQSNYFEHTDCFSIVKHKQSDKLYLYAVFNGARSTFTIDGGDATREQVAALLTPSEAAKLYSDGVVHNVTHNVTHDVTVRTIALHNVEQLNAMGERVQF